MDNLRYSKVLCDIYVYLLLYCIVSLRSSKDLRYKREGEHNHEL